MKDDAFQRLVLGAGPELGGAGDGGPSLAGPGGLRRPGAQRLLRLLALGILALVLLLWARWSLERVAPAVREHLFSRQVEKHAHVLRDASRESGVDAYLLAAIMCAESSGRVGARSSADALGLFQLRMPTAAERADRLGLPPPSEDDLLSDARLNARLGADYFRWLLDLYRGDEVRALVAYNLGPTRLARYAREAGSWEAWRAEREAAGNSDLLAYAAKVMMLRDQFEEKRLLEP